MVNVTKGKNIIVETYDAESKEFTGDGSTAAFVMTGAVAESLGNDYNIHSHQGQNYIGIPRATEFTWLPEPMLPPPEPPSSQQLFALSSERLSSQQWPSSPCGTQPTVFWWPL